MTEPNVTCVDNAAFLTVVLKERDLSATWGPANLKELLEVVGNYDANIY